MVDVVRQLRRARHRQAEHRLQRRLRERDDRAGPPALGQQLLDQLQAGDLVGRVDAIAIGVAQRRRKSIPPLPHVELLAAQAGHAHHFADVQDGASLRAPVELGGERPEPGLPENFCVGGHAHNCRSLPHLVTWRGSASDFGDAGRDARPGAAFPGGGSRRAVMPLSYTVGAQYNLTHTACQKGSRGRRRAGIHPPGSAAAPRVARVRCLGDHRRHDHRPLRRDPRRAPLGRPGALQHRRRLLRPLGRGSRALRALLGRRSRRDRRVHVLGRAAAGQPPLQRARGARRRPRRQGRADPAAAPRDRHRPHRRLPARRGHGAAVVPVRARGARLPARRFRVEGRVRRSAVAPELPGRHAPARPASRTSSAWPARGNRSSCRSRRWWRRRPRTSRRSRRERPTPRSWSTPAARPARRRAR